MKKYRVVELSGGGYGVQKRHWFFRWKLLPITSGYANGAYDEISRLRKKEAEQLAIKNNLKVVRVHGYS